MNGRQCNLPLDPNPTEDGRFVEHFVLRNQRITADCKWILDVCFPRLRKYFNLYLPSQCTELCVKWTDTCVQLTTILWPHHAPHPWTSGLYEPKYTQIFVRRLTEVGNGPARFHLSCNLFWPLLSLIFQIMEVRNVHHVICQILSQKEEEELKVADAFRVFSR